MQCSETLSHICFGLENIKEIPTKVGYLSKKAETSSSAEGLVVFFWVNLLYTIISRWVYHKLSVYMWSACWHHKSSLHSIHMSTNLLKHFFLNMIWSSTDLKHHCAVFSCYPFQNLFQAKNLFKYYFNLYESILEKWKSVSFNPNNKNV